MEDEFEVYIGGKLTGLENPELQKRFYENMASVFVKIGKRVYIPHKHTDPVEHPTIDPRRVFEVDRKRVLEADLMVAWVGEPSLGVGIELGIAAENREMRCNRTDVILVYPKGQISRMVLGNPCVIGKIEYSDETEAIQKLEEFVRGYWGWR